MQAVDGVSFDVHTGETLGIVGESGCGKSTTARLLMHLIPPDIGSIVFDGLVVGAADGGLSHRDLHRQMQMVFQESYASLNPRLPVAMSIAFGPLVPGWPSLRAEARDEAAGGCGAGPQLFANHYPLSYPGASGSGSTSRERWPSSRASSSWMRPSPRSTNRSRRRC